MASQEVARQRMVGSGEGRWRVLLIEDDEDDFLLTRELFEEFEQAGNYELTWIQSFDEGLLALKTGGFDICLLDYRLGAQDGLEFLTAAAEAGIHSPILFLTGAGNHEVDQEAMRRGAADYLVKGEITATLLERAIRHSLERHRFAQGQRFLVAAGMRLTSTLDFEQTLESVVELSAQALADYCVINFFDRHEKNARRSAGSKGWADQEVVKWLAENYLFETPDSSVNQALIQGESFLVSEMSEEFFEELASTPERRQILETMGPRSLMAVPMRARDRVVGCLVFVSARGGRRYDETDLALAEQIGFRAGLAADNARLYQEAKRAIELRDEVHRIVVHDLRNPLNTMGLAVQLMDRQLKRGAAVEVLAEQLQTQRVCIEQMDRLIEDLLDVAKIEDGKLRLNPGAYQPEIIIEDVVSRHQMEADERGITLRAEAAEELPWVEADLRRLEQVLANLIGNALKFTPRGGEIELLAGQDGEFVRFSVRDTGRGIPKAKLPRLFDRFWQVEDGEESGAGLGLAICKGLVEAQGGQIWAESQEGEGTRFEFTVPVYVESF